MDASRVGALSRAAGAARIAVVALVAALLAACATSPYPPAPREAAVAGEYSYRIGPLDVLNVTVWRNPELSASVPVRPDGRISTPLAEDIVALGRTPNELARDIEKALGKFVREPVVSVVVTTFVGPASEQVRVIGEVTKPQALPYRQDMSLLDAMLAVGGLTDFADGNAARLVRRGDGERVYSVRLADLVKRGDVSANVQLRPGDILIVPQSWF